MHNAICWAVNGHHELAREWVAISGVVLAIWMLDAAVGVVSWRVAAGVVIVIGCDVAVARDRHRCEVGSWGVSRGAVV